MTIITSLSEGERDDLTSTAAVFVAIESIQVVDRHRKDLGDLDSLRDSIEGVGLLNPVTLTRDSRLVAGQRRIEACRRLGWHFIPARFVDSLDDAALVLRAEMEENTERKAMLPSELASLGETLHNLEAERSRERQRQAGRENGRGIAPDPERTSYSPGSEQNKTRSIVGSALGMSGHNYDQLRYVYRAARDPDLPTDLRDLAVEELARIDQTGHVRPAAERLRARMRARRDADEAKAAALAAPTDMPAEPLVEQPTKRVNRPAVERLDRIRELAGQGYTSHQIAEQIGTSPEWVRQRARDNDIALHADTAMGRNTRKSIDSNRVVRETVNTLDSLTTGIGLIDFDALDETQIWVWVQSLTTSIAALNRLRKQLKERTQ